MLRWLEESQLQPGRSEAELAWAIEKYFRDNGASELAFPSIVAVDQNAALPHAIPGEKKLPDNGLVLVDVGCRVDGYCSDQTRTFWVGDAPHKEFRETMKLVRDAQQAALDAMLAGLHPGCILPAVVTHLESFGAFVDIGCGVPSLIGIENISVSRIPHPDQRFRVGQAIFAVVQELDPKLGRVYLTHRELLGTWAENAARFQAGMTVPGIVRGLKEYGAFVELTPNLSGLAERKSGLREGDRVSVYIKAILPERMKIKLLAIDTLPPLNVPAPLEYFLTQGQIEKWKYAPEGCVKVGAETIFA